LCQAGGHGSHILFGHGAPGAALGAAPQPFGRLVAALLADKHRSSGPGHEGDGVLEKLRLVMPNKRSFLILLDLRRKRQ